MKRIFLLTVLLASAAFAGEPESREVKNLKIARISIDRFAVELNGLKVYYHDPYSEEPTMKMVSAYVEVNDDNELQRWMDVKKSKAKVSIVYSSKNVVETEDCPFPDLMYKVKYDGQTEQICYSLQPESISYN